MSLTKRVLKHPRTQVVLSWLLSLYIRLVYATSRISWHIHPDTEAYMRGEQNAIFAFWHGRMMMLPAFNPSRKMHVLISLHRDGLLISQVIHHFGQSTIGGSSSKGGALAVKDILRRLKAGDNIGITPDGPRGPFQVASSGVATVARITGKPVLPITFSASRHVRFKSWDRFMLALPFGHIVFCAGSPIFVTDEVEGLPMIERAMNQLVETADGYAA